MDEGNNFPYSVRNWLLPAEDWFAQDTFRYVRMSKAFLLTLLSTYGHFDKGKLL